MKVKKELRIDDKDGKEVMEDIAQISEDLEQEYTGEDTYNKRATGTRRSYRWTKYQKYRPVWENDPLLNKWMIPAPEDDTKVICRYCQCFLRAHKSDLLSHMATSKHLRNEEGIETGEYVMKPFQLPTKVRKSRRKPEDEMEELMQQNGDEDSPYRRKKLKGKVAAADGSYIIVESGEPGEEGDGAEGYALSPPRKSNKKSYGSVKIDNKRRKTNSRAGYLTSRVGNFILADIEDMMAPMRPLGKLLSEEVDQLDSNGIKKVARLCVAELSRKYLVDASLEAARANVDPNAEIGGGVKLETLSSQLTDLRKQLQETVADLNGRMTVAPVEEEAVAPES